MPKKFEVGLKIAGDSTGAVRAMKLTQAEMAKLANQSQRDMRRVSESTNRASSQFTALAGVVGVLGGALGAIGVAGFFKDVIKEQEALQRNMLRTQALVTSTGKAAGFSAQQLHDQSRELALATLQSTDGILQAQQVLLSFKSVSGETFTRAIELANDLAVTTGGSLKAAVTQLGKALEDPVKGLNSMTRSGVSFSDQSRELIKNFAETNQLAKAQALILDELAGQYRGIAQNEAKGLAGAVDTLGQRIEEFKIHVGNNSETLEKWTTLVNLAVDAVLIWDRTINGINTGLVDDRIANFNRDISTARDELAALEEKAAKLSGPVAGFLFSTSAGVINDDIIAKEQEINSLLTFRAVLMQDLNDKRREESNAVAPVEDILEENDKIITRVTNSTQLVSAYDKEIKKLIEKNIALTVGERALYSYQLTQLKFTDIEKRTALAIYDANKALRDKKSAAQVAQKATEAAQKATEDALKESATKLDDIDSRLNDLGATSLDVFDGMASDVFNIVTAFDQMSHALQVNGDDLQTNKKLWDEYIASTADVGGERAEKIAEFSAREQELSKQTAAVQIQGINNITGATVGMLNSIADLQEQGSQKQIAYQKAAMGVQAAMAVVQGVTAVLNAFQGDPYTAIPRAVLTAGIVAVQLAQIGKSFVGVSGGGGGPSESQLTQGTGTVLGDAGAISKSLGNSTQILEDYAKIGNEHSSTMLISLQNIDNNTKELGKEVGRSDQFSFFTENPLDGSKLASGETISLGQDDSGYFAGQYEKSNFGGALAGAIDGIISLFSGGLSTVIAEVVGNSSGEVKDFGISLGAPKHIGPDTDRFEIDNQTLGEILNDGAETYYFALVDQFTAVGNAARVDSFTANIFTKIQGSVDRWFSDILIDMTNVLVEGASFFDPAGTDALIEQIKNIEVPFTKIDLTGLNSEESQEAINAVFSALGDTITEELFPQVSVFQQVGEGLFETFVRVVAEVENATTALSTVGIAAIDYTEVLNKQNDIEGQVARQSILLNVQFGNIADVMGTLSGDAGELVKSWITLRDIQFSLIGSGIGSDIDLSTFIGSSGGEGNAQSNLDTFLQGFFTEEEQFAIELGKLEQAFKLINAELPESKEGFREMVIEAGKLGDAGAMLAAQLLSQADAVIKVSDAWEILNENTLETAETAEETAARIASLSDTLKGIAVTFSRIDDSDFKNTMSNIADTFTSYLETVVEQGGSIDNMIFVVTTGIQTGIRVMDDAIDQLQSSFAALQKVFDAKQFGVNLDLLRVTGGNVSAAEEAYYREQLATGNIDEQIQAATNLQTLIMSNYDEQTQVVEDFGDFIGDIQGYVDSLKLNDQLSILTPAQMLAESEAQFRETLALAQSGDTDAASAVTSEFNTFLEKARVVYASGDEYTRLFNEGVDDLLGISIPDTQDFDKINADASQQAVTELEEIRDILNKIESKASAQLSSDLITIDAETKAVYNDFISAISKLTDYTNKQIVDALDPTKNANDQIQNIVSGNTGGGLVGNDPDVFAYDIANPGTPAIEPNDFIVSAQAIRNFVTENAADPFKIYAAAYEYDVSAAEIDKAMGWPAGSTNEWADINGLARFANGGVANQPSIFGEAGPEAAVPLPDGRSIPVIFQGNSGSSKSYQELIDEIKGLRQDMAEQTGALIESNYDAHEQSSEKVSGSIDEQTDNQQWQNNKIPVT